MNRNRLAALLLTFAPLIPMAALSADEAPGYRPDPAFAPARVAAVAPLRLAESLSLEPLARLAPAAEAARDQLAAMKEWNSNPRRPHRVGFPRELSQELRLRVERRALANQTGARVGGGFLARGRGESLVWGTSVEVAGAKALRLELEEVQLPAGARLWVYGTGGAARDFDLRQLTSKRTLISPTIEGERIHLEVEIPGGSIADGQGFVVRRVQEQIQTFASLAPMADECLQNAECFDSGDFAAIEDVRDAILQFLFVDADDGFTYTCSGGLLNDNAPGTLEPWILTANHCVDTQSEAQSLDAWFAFRYDSCAENEIFHEQAFGADLIATSPDTDVSLLRLADPSEVPSGAYFLGWTSVRPADGTVLHRLSHPVRDADSDILPQQYSRHRLDETPDIECFDDGAPLSHYLYSFNEIDTGISGGSSGAPVVRNDGIVVGQLFGTCGTPPERDGCGTDESVVDGAFAASYPLLQPYLTPGEGGICVRDADTACLLDGRFKIEVTWQTVSATGDAQVMSFNGERAENVESAFFWFFNASNFEMGVKLVDACVPPFNRFWVFVSGLTSQGYTVTVTKMSNGATQVYTNGIDEIPTTAADTDAFDCSL